MLTTAMCNCFYKMYLLLGLIPQLIVLDQLAALVHVRALILSEITAFANLIRDYSIDES